MILGTQYMRSMGFLILQKHKVYWKQYSCKYQYWDSKILLWGTRSLHTSILVHKWMDKMEENYFIGYRLIRWHVNILKCNFFSPFWNFTNNRS